MIKSEPKESDKCIFSRDDSPDTLAATSEGPTTHPTSIPSQSAIHGQDLIAQLIEHATAPAQGEEVHHEAVTTLSSSDISGCESVRTDFLPSNESPSLRKSKLAPKCTANKRRRRAKDIVRSISKMPPIRRPDFGRPVKKIDPKEKSDNVLSLKNLRDIERAPSHAWDEDERELLCILHRWYCVHHRPTELITFASVFNSITGLDIKPSRIRTQFESHLLLYGGNAYPEYHRVFSIPFEDPQGCYSEIRTLIECEAQDLGLKLEKRRSDLSRSSGRAQFAKSPRIKKIYKSLVRRASRDTNDDGTRRSDRRLCNGTT